MVVWHQTYLETVSVDVSSPQNCSLRGESNNTQSDDESSFFTPVSNPSVHVLYVADGYFEYSNSWRLQEIVRQTGSPLHLGTLTVCQAISSQSRGTVQSRRLVWSCLNHPWRNPSSWRSRTKRKEPLRDSRRRSATIKRSFQPTIL